MLSDVKPLSQGLKSGKSKNVLPLTENKGCRALGETWYEGCQPRAERLCPIFVDCHPFSKHFCHSQLNLLSLLVPKEHTGPSPT